MEIPPLEIAVTSPPSPDAAPEANACEPRDLTVIVPVYEDDEATARCLDSLEAQSLPGWRWRVVVVNDASPNAAIVTDIQRRAAEGRLDVVTNRTNVGFAAAINRAADGISTGDFLLLNADTLLPNGALVRMMRIATSTPDLGTLTPLSNNGVVTSFPKAFAINDMPSIDDLRVWDDAARGLDLLPVSIPNGIGFCLWVTRACWDAVGRLPLIYGRGYFEDVDFTLDARLRGFRNLCAMNLIVGHAGSRSFGTRRWRLIRRNGARLNARFPDYGDEYDAFRAAEPFRAGFAEIERRIAPPAYDLLVVDPLPARKASLTSRLAAEYAAGRSVLILKPDGGEVGERLKLQGYGDRLPQSLSFSLVDPAERRNLCSYIRATGVKHLLIAAPERCPQPVASWALSLKIPVELLLEGPLPPSRLIRRAAVLSCADGMTLADAKRQFPRRLLSVIQSHSSDDPSIRRSAPRGRPALGILSPIPSAELIRFVQAIELHLRASAPSVPIIVLGATVSDLTLMADRATFVTGPVSRDEVGALAARLSVGGLVLPNRKDGFDHLEAASAGTDVPRAYFDRSGGTYPHRHGDLALDSAADTSESAIQVAQWFLASVGASA